MSRVVLHVDLDGFYAQVEGHRVRSAYPLPLAVRQWDGIIAVNYAAKALGCTRFLSPVDMSGFEGRVRFVHVHTFDADGVSHEEVGADGGQTRDRLKSKVSLARYRIASRRIFSILLRIVGEACVEKASVDEAFLDVTPLVDAFLGDDHGVCARGVIMEQGGKKDVIRSWDPGIAYAHLMSDPAGGSVYGNDELDAGAPDWCARPTTLPEFLDALLSRAAAQPDWHFVGASGTDVPNPLPHLPFHGMPDIVRAYREAERAAGGGEGTEEAAAKAQAADVAMCAEADVSPRSVCQRTEDSAAIGSQQPAHVRGGGDGGGDGDGGGGADPDSSCCSTAASASHPAAATAAAIACTTTNLRNGGLSAVQPTLFPMLSWSECGEEAPPPPPASRVMRAAYKQQLATLLHANSASDVRMLVGAYIAAYIRWSVFKSLGYTMSAGVAPNKMLAKLGSARNKPHQQTIITHASILPLMAATPLTKIRFLGGKYGAELEALVRERRQASCVPSASPDIHPSLESQPSACGAEAEHSPSVVAAAVTGVTMLDDGGFAAAVASGGGGSDGSCGIGAPFAGLRLPTTASPPAQPVSKAAIVREHMDLVARSDALLRSRSDGFDSDEEEEDEEEGDAQCEDEDWDSDDRPSAPNCDTSHTSQGVRTAQDAVNERGGADQRSAAGERERPRSHPDAGSVAVRVGNKRPREEAAAAEPRILAGDVHCIPLSMLVARFGESTGRWMHDIVRGLDVSPIKARLKPRSMLAIKSFPAAECASLQAAERWLRMIAVEIVQRVEEDEEAWHRWPQTLVLHHRRPFTTWRNGVKSKSGAMPPKPLTVDCVTAAAMRLLHRVLDEDAHAMHLQAVQQQRHGAPPPGHAVAAGGRVAAAAAARRQQQAHGVRFTALGLLATNFQDYAAGLADGTQATVLALFKKAVGGRPPPATGGQDGSDDGAAHDAMRASVPGRPRAEPSIKAWLSRVAAQASLPARVPPTLACTQPSTAGGRVLTHPSACTAAAPREPEVICLSDSDDDTGGATSTGRRCAAPRIAPAVQLQRQASVPHGTRATAMQGGSHVAAPGSAFLHMFDGYSKGKRGHSAPVTSSPRTFDFTCPVCGRHTSVPSSASISSIDSAMAAHVDMCLQQAFAR